MRCACRPDAGLYYEFSEDLKIYPEQNGYMHDRYCCRFKNQTGSEQQKPPYYIGEDGDVTVFTSGYRKKILLLIRSKSSEKLSYNPDLYVQFVVDSSMPIIEKHLYTLVR